MRGIPPSRRILAAAAPLALLAALLRFWLAFSPYPELEAFLVRGWTTSVLDREGGLLARVPAPDGTDREYAELSELPDLLVHVFVRSEDKRFGSHPGVDPVAILRSLVLNVRTGRIASGASTIPMQLASMIDPGAIRGGGYPGKLRQGLDALRISARLGRGRTLELYLSSLHFAPLTEGVVSAARLYFGKAPAGLDPAEICILAVIPRRPARYDPRIDPEATARAAWLLSRLPGLPAGIFDGLDETGFLVAAKRAASSASRRDGVADSVASSIAPHFIRRVVILDEGVRGRRRVRTTLDPRIQRILGDAIRRRVADNRQYRMSNGAGIVVDNATGEILAYAGSADFGSLEDRGQVDGVAARGQPGSCLKPFLYAAAIERGYLPSTLLPDLPSDFGDVEVYVPRNFNDRFNGSVRLRVALASSLNVPAVHVLESLGVDRFASFLERLGFTDMTARASGAGVGLALGNTGTSLEELVRGFAVFPRGGRSLSLRTLLPDPGGRSAPHRGEVVMEPYTAGIVADMLADDPSRFAGFGRGRVMDTDYDAMFKTGTANQYQHVWALGATIRHSAGVWMGNFTGETLVGARSSGIPAQVLVSVLDEISRDAPALPPPPGSVRVPVDALTGAVAAARASGTVDEYLPVGMFMRPGSTLGPRRTEPRLLHPREGARFYVDPSLPAGSQAVGVRIEFPVAVDGAGRGTEGKHDREGSRPDFAGTGISLLVNGVSFGDFPGDGRLVLPLERGSYRLSLRYGGREVDSASIEVR